MKREQAREIGLFFLLGLMEERVALSAASRAIAQLKAEFSELSRKDREREAVSIGALIKACRESWKTHRKLIPRNQVTEAPSGGWLVPPGVDLAVWARYQKDAPDEDIMAVLFFLVLGVSDDDLAEGFQTSTGTIRYRLGKGVRQLGLVARGSGPSTAARTAGRS